MLSHFSIVMQLELWRQWILHGSSRMIFHRQETFTFRDIRQTCGKMWQSTESVSTCSLGLSFSLLSPHPPAHWAQLQHQPAYSALFHWLSGIHCLRPRYAFFNGTLVPLPLGLPSSSWRQNSLGVWLANTWASSWLCCRIGSLLDPLLRDGGVCQSSFCLAISHCTCTWNCT